MANGASLVPNINPLVQSLQQFTPQAREDRRLQLAALGEQSQIRQGTLAGQEQQLAGQQQQAQIRALQIQEAEREQKVNQAIDTGRQALVMFDEDIFDIETVTKEGPEGLKNAITRLAAEKGPDSPDFAEFAEFANMAATDPEGAFAELTSRRDQIVGKRKITEDSLDRIEGRQRQALSRSGVTYANGTTLQRLSTGDVVVKNAANQTLTGQSAVEAVEAGVASGISETGKKAGARATATGASKRNADLIDRGLAAAESTATIRRALTLLETVETGGVDAIALATRQKLGIEGADEGELSNSLGKAVLSQLKETFGAAFTAQEGERLSRIEAGFGKSVATNKRLLRQALRLSERAANRGKRAAKKEDFGDVVSDIDELLKFSLDIAPPGAAVQPGAPATAAAPGQAPPGQAAPQQAGQPAAQSGSFQSTGGIPFKVQ